MYHETIGHRGRPAADFTIQNRPLFTKLQVQHQLQTTTIAIRSSPSTEYDESPKRRSNNQKSQKYKTNENDKYSFRRIRKSSKG